MMVLIHATTVWLTVWRLFAQGYTHIIGAIPGTRGFHRKQLKQIARGARESKQLAAYVHSPNKSTKQQAHTEIHQAMRKLAIVETQLEMIYRVIAFPLLSVLLIVATRIGDDMVNLVWQPITPTGWWFLLLLPAFCLLFGPAYAILKHPHSRLRTGLFAIIVWPVILLIVATTFLQVYGNTLPPLMIAFLTALLKLYPCSMALNIFVIVLSIALYGFQRWKRRAYMEEVILVNLLRVRAALAHVPKQRARSAEKQILCFRLKWTAACISHDFASTMPINAYYDPEWRTQCRRAAFGLSSVMAWVRAPSESSRNEIIERLDTYINCAVRGYWGDLGRTAPGLPPRTFQQLFRSIVDLGKRIGRVAGLSSIPFAGLWLMQWFNSPPSDTLADVIKGMSVLLMIVLFGSEFYPNFSAIMTTVNGLLSTIRFPSSPRP